MLRRFAPSAAARFHWRSRILIAVVGGMMLLLWPPSTGSHPHLTVEYTLEFVVGVRGPEGIRLTWTLDLAASQTLLGVFDTDRNGTLSPAEARRLEEHVRQEQGPVQFFTTIRLDGESLSTPSPQGFGATVNRGRLTYQFVMPLRGKESAQGAVEVVLDDPDYYVAFILAEGQPVSVKAAPPFAAECRVVRERAAYMLDVIKCTYTRRGS